MIRPIISMILMMNIVFHTAKAEELVYCPADIWCAEEGALNSCIFEQHPQGYWGRLTGNTVLAGQYRLSYVSAPDPAAMDGYAICVFTHVNSYKTLSLRAISGERLVRFDDGTETQWRQEETWWECRPEIAAMCPMVEEKMY
jgi:hypothetical protein